MMKAILCHYSRADLLTRQIPFVRKFVGPDIEVVVSGPKEDSAIRMLCQKMNIPYTYLHCRINWRANWYYGMTEMVKRHNDKDLVFFEADTFPIKTIPGFKDKQFWSPVYPGGEPVTNVLTVKKGYELVIDPRFPATAKNHPDLGQWSLSRDMSDDSYCPEYIEDFAIHLDKSERERHIPGRTEDGLFKIIDQLEKDCNITPTLFDVVRKAVGSKVTTTLFRRCRTSEMEYEERLAICDGCEHVTRNRKGRVYTCGPMLQSLMDPNLKTCGCVLRAKARDKKQKCPFGYWPDLE